MAQVLIRNINDDIVERLKAHAAARGMRLEQLLREIISDSARHVTRDERLLSQTGFAR